MEVIKIDLSNYNKLLFVVLVDITTNKLVRKLVLVNPATSYDKTNWPLLGEIVAKSPNRIFPAVGLDTLLGNHFIIIITKNIFSDCCRERTIRANRSEDY